MSEIKFDKNTTNYEPISIIITHDKYKKFAISSYIDTNKRDEEIILVNDYMLNCNSILNVLDNLDFRQVNKTFIKTIGDYDIEVDFCNRNIHISLSSELNKLFYNRSIGKNHLNVIGKIELLIKRVNELKVIYDEIDKI